MRPLTTDYIQVRMARPTDQLKEVIRFYRDGLGLIVVGSFHEHEGYTGIMLGLPDARVHLEFTQHAQGSPCPAPTRDNLLVFYFPDIQKRDALVAKMNEMGYPSVEPENSYWLPHGITIEDPDGWRVVLMNTDGFTIETP